ncbi:hypothetical protein [Burkholderia orbicola]|uniref:hypothetical protein n=1 Tax=Burkholderia orbicola TaxID=2978683 RepID=UPI00264BA10F|nr:hypothetical protein [Burkholderia orbicola]MDN7562285.1 hypothetical protein [Burkholderia orbicola]
MTGEEFQTRLDEAFTHEGEMFGRLALISEAQATFRSAASKFNGHRALSDAFKACFLEAVELLNGHCRPRVKEPLTEHYALFLPRLTNSFHTLCAAELTAANGYPRPAFTTLRNVFDDCVLTSAALLQVTDFYKIEGLDPANTGDFDPNAAKRARKKTEFEVRQVMTGSSSDLGEATIYELDMLNQLYDLEVHGSRLSLANAMNFMKGTGPLPVVPVFIERDYALFMNRYNEVAWAVHRLLPAMQPPGVPMPSSWASRWALVDESFEIVVRSLSLQLGKKVGDAYADFIKAKFPFTAEKTFPL